MMLKHVLKLLYRDEPTTNNKFISILCVDPENRWGGRNGCKV